MARYVYEDPVKLYEMEAANSVHTFETVRHRYDNYEWLDTIRYHFFPSPTPLYLYFHGVIFLR